MAAKTATREVEIVVVNAEVMFGMDRPCYGEIVQVVGIDHMEGVRIAHVGRSYREICDTCLGTGFRPEYAGLFGGTCFYCRGCGLRELIGSGTADELVKVLVRRAKARVRAAAKRQAKAAAESAAHKVWLAANPAVQEIADRFGRLGWCGHGGGCYRGACEAVRAEIRETHDPILLELAGAATCRIISEKQVALLSRLVEQHAVAVKAREVKAGKVAEQKWLGAEKEKISATGVLGKPVYLDGDYGTRTLYKLTTADGDRVAWFRTGFHEFEAGATVTLTGTVKKLTESEKYGKETQLTRCKIS